MLGALGLYGALTAGESKSPPSKPKPDPPRRQDKNEEEELTDHEALRGEDVFRSLDADSDGSVDTRCI